MKKLLTLVVTLSLLGVIAVGTTKAAGADMATGNGSVTINGSSQNCAFGGDIMLSNDGISWEKNDVYLGNYNLNSGESTTFTFYMKNDCDSTVGGVGPLSYKVAQLGTGSYNDRYLNVKIVDVRIPGGNITMYDGLLSNLNWENSYSTMVYYGGYVTQLQVTYTAGEVDGTVNIPVELMVVQDL